MDGEKSSERDCEGDAWTRFGLNLGLQEKEMEIGFAGFLFCIEWNGMEEKEIKNESGNILTGQAGMKVMGWREVVWAGMKRYAVKGC